MYSVSNYGAMIADQVRMGPYVEALRRYVKPDSVVIDIGTGTGIFALLACQFGARKVYAIEPAEAIQLAREIATANDYASRIEFVEDISTRVNLPERADVIVSDLRGLLPLYDHNLIAIIDARKRFLAAGGILIPQKDILWASVVNAPELYQPIVQPWEEYNYGLNLQAARRITVNSMISGRVAPEQLLVEPQQWALLDYTILESLDVSAELAWTVNGEGTGHGLSIWFDTLLADGIGFSNAPGGGAKVYGSAFFPWSEPVELSAGDQISVSLKANMVGDDYVWTWNTVVRESGNSGKIKAQFRQSTFFAQPVTSKRLRKQADDYVPQLNTDGLIDQFILGLMNNEYTQAEIASRVCERFPHRFADWRDALTKIGELSNKYSS